MWKYALLAVLTLVLVWVWEVLKWVWLKPKKVERLFRKQGMKGNPYKLLYGDTKEAQLMYEEAYSRPIGLYDDTLPRLMPDILLTARKYGNFSFMWMGPRPRVLILDPNVIKDVLKNYRTFQKSYKILNHLVKMLVTGLARKEGDEWNKSRMKLNTAFLLDKLKPMVPGIQECAENIMNQWKELASKEGGSCVVDVYPFLEIYTSSVLARLMFGSVYTDSIKRTFLQLAELGSLGKLATNVFTLPGEKYFPTKRNQRAKEIDKFVRASLTEMVNIRLEKRGEVKEWGKMDLLDIFMEELYAGNATSQSERQRIIEEVIENCRVFFFGGFETSCNLLTWTMITLSYHPTWQDRAREEVMQVLGNKDVITSDDLNKLKIVTMIVHEMLRLYPPGMELSRVVYEDTKIGDYIIPEGTMVTCPTLILHRSPEIWGDDALEFNPQRFAEGVVKATKGEKNNVYMPFGGGPRMCIGPNFAMLEMKTFIAMLLRNFSFELSPAYTHAPYVDFTVHPQYGAPLVLRQL